MKKISYLICAMFFTCQVGSAQDIQEMDKTMSLGSKSAFVITHPRASEKMAESAWANHMKKYGKSKKNRKSKEFETIDTEINMITSNNLTIYYVADGGKEQVTSYIYFDDGSKFITSENDGNAADGIYEFLTPFVYDVEKLVIEKDLDNEEDSLKDLTKSLDRLEKGNTDLHEDIEKYQEKIRQAELDIEQNLTDQEAKRTEISNQEGVVEQVKKKLNKVGKN